MRRKTGEMGAAMGVRGIGLGLTAVLALGVTSAEAQVRPRDRAGAIQKLIDCRALTDNVARLACFDTTAAALDQAEAKGDIVVVDKEQVKEVRKQAFGFSLPSLNVFNRGDKAEREPELDRITATLARAWRTSSGKWVMELEDGAVWVQSDTEPLPRGAKAGSRVEIRQAALGSFLINVDGQRAIRANRSK
jgi:hypothetical protein